jgi:hypothetical protein
VVVLTTSSYVSLVKEKWEVFKEGWLTELTEQNLHFVFLAHLPIEIAKKGVV